MIWGVGWQGVGREWFRNAPPSDPLSGHLLPETPALVPDMLFLARDFDNERRQGCCVRVHPLVVHLAARKLPRRPQCILHEMVDAMAKLPLDNP